MRQLILQTMLLSILSFLLASCGPEVIAPKEKVVVKSTAEVEHFSYELQGPDCSTGKKEYYSMQELCEELLNEKENDHCATEQRKRLYNSHRCETFHST